MLCCCAALRCPSLCCAAVPFAVLCCAVLCCAALRCAVLRCAALRCAALCYAIVYNSLLNRVACDMQGMLDFECCTHITCNIWHAHDALQHALRDAYYVLHWCAWPVLPCNAVPYCTLPYSTVPYPSPAYPTLPCNAMPCHAIRCRTAVFLLTIPGMSIESLDKS